MVDGQLLATGKVGAEVTPEQGKELAAQCALNGLAAVDWLVGPRPHREGRQGGRFRGLG
jgi:hypothetical protein